jgi:Ni,Fe-hydrogenase III large subunit
METLIVKNAQSFQFDSIPLLSQQQFYAQTIDLLNQDSFHCVNYFALDQESRFLLIICLADDSAATIHVYAHAIAKYRPLKLPSISQVIFAMHVFEREIAEKFPIQFENHPWPKPVRYPHDRHEKEKNIYQYPFYKIEGEPIHEVGVGPIHAGVIEPGHFRFQCLGEYVHHLEIQLGWQHRGVESLMLNLNKCLQRNVLAESIAGDTAIGHSIAYSMLIESLKNISADKNVLLQRSLALELERIAIHIGDLSAMATDVSYQLGANVFGALRTPIINFMQLWCGNRFGKGLIRVGKINYPLTIELCSKLTEVIKAFELKFVEMADEMFALPSILSRFETTGQLHISQIKNIGAVGMVARMVGLSRDIRFTHPFAYFNIINYQPITLEQGDVWARAKLRQLEIMASIQYIKVMIEEFQKETHTTTSFSENQLMAKASMSIALVEGWRGEICHCAITDYNANLLLYKIKDPSLHNWNALALALRENEISDFPINNKSFDLSYCGHDL